MDQVIEMCLMGGLGNQLFQFAYGKYQSKFGANNLVLDYSHSSARKNFDSLPEICQVIGNKSCMFSNREFGKLTAKLRNLGIRISTSDSIVSKITQPLLSAALGLSLSNIWRAHEGRVKVILARGVGSYEGIDNFQINNSYFIGYFQSGKIVSTVIKEDMATKSLLQEFVQSSRDRWKHLEPEKSAVLHFRRGDYKSSNFGILSDNYYRNALRKVQIREPLNNLYAISDEESDDLLKEIRIISDKIKFISTSNLSSSEVLGLIAQFGAVVGANSSLSWWGATLGGLVQPNFVVFPEKWFRAGLSPESILKEDWVTIGGDIWKD